MTIQRIRHWSHFLFAGLLAMACSPPKTLYLSNKTHQAITLMVDKNDLVKNSAQEISFKDSLHGKRIEPGHSIIYFGKGDWTKNDIENLKAVLAKTTVQMDDTNAGYRLSGTTHVAHYRLFVEELLVKFRMEHLKR